MSRKLLSYFIVITLILVGSVLGYFYQINKQKPLAEPIVPQAAKKEIPAATAPETIDTTDWKLYQNKKYGYEMKYPSDWDIITANLAPAEDFSAPVFSLSEAKILSQVSIGNIHEITPGETIETGLPWADSKSQLNEKRWIKVDGKNAILVEFFQSSLGRRNGKMGRARREIKVINGNLSYIITLDEENDDLEVLDSSRLWKNKAIMDAMAESFRFLDTAAIFEKPAGIVYANPVFGFTLALPEGWEKYQVSIQKDKGDDNHTYIYFMMPTTDKLGGAYDKNTGKLIPDMADIFVITATSLSTWNKDINSQECKTNPNPECPDESSVLAKNNKYVFTAHHGNGITPKDVQKFVTESAASGFFSGKFKLTN